ncbi:MAG: hypothetical protein HYZ75_16695 [Elusimicrobia bacterium]|nr:hypothetical protein [Elusimicrobiota bacterium]
MEAAANDPKRFTLDRDSIEIVRLDNPTPAGADPLPPFPGGGTPGGGDPISEIDRIVNLAKKIFDIIKENRPVVDITTSYANAVPEGMTHWSQLAGWTPPQTNTYGFYAKNGWGSRVVEVTYQVIRQHSGSYKGKGKFLNSVTVQPLHVSVSWGYKFSMKFEAPTVSNVGTSEDPVASMLARLNWSIDTVLQHDEGTSIYDLQGDGAYREIGGPFKSAAREGARASIQRAAGLFVPAAALRGAESMRAVAGRAW